MSRSTYFRDLPFNGEMAPYWLKYTRGHSSVYKPAKTYIHQLCANIGCHFERLPSVIADRDRWWEGVKGVCCARTPWWFFIWLNKTDTLLLPISDLFYISHLTSGWNKFKKLPYFSPSTFGPSWSHLPENKHWIDKHCDKSFAFIWRVRGRTSGIYKREGLYCR